jgi:hypothetical protein
MGTLWDAGEREAALAKGAADAVSPDAARSAGSELGWLLNAHASLLAKAGQVDAADARFRELDAIDVDMEPWVLNMRLNHVGMLLDHDRGDAVLAQIVPLIPLVDKYGTDYSRQLVRQFRACANVQAGNPAEAEAEMGALLAHAGDAPQVTAKALLCLGDATAAASQLVAALESEKWRAMTIADLQPAWVHGDREASQLR